MNDWTVSIITDHVWTETCRPIAIGVDKAVANSIERHYRKVLKYNDYTQTGQYVVKINRTYCLNHEDFERNTEEEV